MAGTVWQEEKLCQENPGKPMETTGRVEGAGAPSAGSAEDNKQIHIIIKLVNTSLRWLTPFQFSLVQVMTPIKTWL